MLARRGAVSKCLSEGRQDLVDGGAGFDITGLWTGMWVLPIDQLQDLHKLVYISLT